MQKAAPAHLKQYAGAYVQQNVVDSSLRAPVSTSTPSRSPAPLPDKLNQSHSGEVGTEQHNAQFLNLFQADAAPGVPSQPTTLQPGSSYDQPTPSSSQSDLDFIMNPQQPPKSPGLFSFGGSSLPKRILLAVGGMFLLLILFVVVKGVVGGNGGSATALVTVAKDQQELIHLATGATQNATTDVTKNFSATALISLQSEQNQLVSYLKTNGHKVAGKELSLKISKATDAQLAAAKSASTFDETYKSIMQEKLKAYQTDIQKAYNQTTGTKGRALLTDDIKAANLLLEQLGS